MFRRAAGVLLHPTSLPGGRGCGGLGPAARAFLDWLASAGFRCWQVLPLGPTGRSGSPYAALSAFAGNPSLISVQLLREDGLLPARERSDERHRSTTADLAAARRHRLAAVRSAFARFERNPPAMLAREFERFAEAPAQRTWLEDWVLFAALRRAHRGRVWTGWDEPLKLRRRAALVAAGRSLRAETAFERFVQFLFARQWSALRARADERGVTLIGDVPIYVALDSADVWARPELFRLDRGLKPTQVAGCPPDAYSRTGQLWRQPLYRWDRIRRERYRWWVERMRVQIARTPLVRVDHFRGFCAHWAVPAGHRTARDGRWEPGPGLSLFRAIERGLGGLPLIAEDLGVITPDVDALRARLRIPGMRVAQFGFDDDDGKHRPDRYRWNCVAYTGTHDNDTTRGWYASASAPRRERVRGFLRCPDNGVRVVRGLVEAVCASRARLAVIPAQDLLGLGSAARMNVPGTARGNWRWRARSGAWSNALAARTRRLLSQTRR